MKLLGIFILVLFTYLMLRGCTDAMAGAHADMKALAEEAQYIDPTSEATACVSTYNSAGVATRCVKVQ